MRDNKVIKMDKNKYALKTGKAGEQQLDGLDAAFGDKTREFLQQLSISTRLHIADIGCGIGNVAIWIANEVKQNGGMVYAIDESEEQLSLAKEKAKKENVDNIQFIKTSAYDLT